MGVSKASFSSVFVRRCVRRACFPVWRPLCLLRLRALLILCADQQLSGLSGFLQATRQIYGGRVQQRREDENHVAGQEDRDERGNVVCAEERKEREQQRVDDLADQRGARVAQPQKRAAVASVLLGERPPFMVKPHVESLA